MATVLVSDIVYIYIYEYRNFLLLFFSQFSYRQCQGLPKSWYIILYISNISRTCITLMYMNKFALIF